MHVGYSIAKARHGQPNRQVDRTDLMVTGTSEVDIAVRQFFRPRVLILLSLAVMYAGFIYSYKLSQYQQHPELSRASLTRAWVDHRNDSIATVSHQRVTPAGPDRLLALAVIAIAALRIAPRSPDLVLEHPAPVREAFLFSSLIPFRAPPSTHPSLA